MSESAHIRNLLKKSSSYGNDTISDNREILPRFGLRGASFQIIDSLYGIFFDLFSNYEKKLVLVTYSLYADSDECSFYSTAGNIENIDIAPQGDFFESFPDLFITILASNDHSFGYPPPEPDAVYIHDGENPDDVGEIELKIYLPKKVDELKDYLLSSKLLICGVLAHEMQHVVQKHCYRRFLGNTSGESLLTHAFDQNEIDSRVEEILAAFEDGIPEEDEISFKESLELYLNKYLLRNTTEENKDSIPKDIRSIMFEQHMQVYKNKMRGIL